MARGLLYESRRRARSLSSLDRVTHLDNDLVPLWKRPPPPSGLEIDRIQYHIGLQNFGIDLQKAANAIFPGEQNSRYMKVDVILLSWEDEDFNLPVSEEIQELDDIFTRFYGYYVEQWHIPADDCHNKLQAKILQFLGDSDPRHLKIVYYAGHGKLTNHHQLAWTSWRNSGNDRCPTVKWSGIQNTLEESRSDVLILLDCCSSGICTADEGNGVTELIAACAYNALANPVGPYSFTHALNTKLRLLIQRPDFTIGVLYNAIFTEVQSQQHQDPRYEKAPVHLVLSQNQNMPRSIRLSSCLKRKGKSKEAPIPITPHCLPKLKSMNNNLTDYSSASEESPTPGADSSSGLSSSSSATSLVSMSEVQQYPRLLFSVRIADEVKTKDLSTELFTDWLRDLPVAASLVRVEAGFASDSTLMMISMPVGMLGYLPSNPAITLLGTIRSQNLLAMTEVKPEASLDLVENKQSSLFPSAPLTPGITPSNSFKIPKHQMKSGTLENPPNEKLVPTNTREQTQVVKKANPPTPSSEVMDLTHEREGDSPENFSEEGTDNSFIDDYSIGDNSDAETITTYATTHDRSSVTPVPRLYSATTRSDYSYFPRTPSHDRQFSFASSPIKVQEDESTSRSDSLSTSIPIVTVSKWGSATPPSSQSPQNVKRTLNSPKDPTFGTPKEREDLHDEYSYISSWDKKHVDDIPPLILPAGLPQHAKHVCQTCAANGRKTEVLWGDTCYSCGTNC